MSRVGQSIVVFGSINMDLVTTVESLPSPGQTVTGRTFALYPGGKGANQAVAAARLGAPVHLVGCVGSDAFGHQLQSALDAAGVDTTYLARKQGSSGTATILVTAAGENTIVVTPGANHLLSPADVERNRPLICDAGIVLTQLETPLPVVERLAEVCAEEGTPFMLDPAPAHALPAALLARITWFTPNETEASFYAEGGREADLAATLLRQGVQNVILKRGAEGVHLIEQSGRRESLPAFHVPVRDTTAAGDCFNGAFAAGLMMGKTPRESAVFASAAAAISVTRDGAQPSMPTLAETEELLAVHGMGS